jgi:uncharacterized protein (TIGR03086 family)
MLEIDRRNQLVASFDHAAGMVAGVRRDQLGAPTPCPDFTVADLVDHLVGAGWQAVTLGRDESPAGAEFPHVDLADAPDQLRRAGMEAQAAWTDDARLAARVTLPWGETHPGVTVVNMYLAEVAGHTWDLAAATGQLERLEPRLGTTALEAARAMLRPEYRNVIGNGNPFGSEIEAPPDATEWERFAAFLGRQPRNPIEGPSTSQPWPPVVVPDLR